MTRRAVCALAFTAGAVLHGGAQSDVLGRIRDEALSRSQAQAYFATLTDQFGPRLTGTPAYRQAADWAIGQMKAIGLDDPHLEPWSFGRGWALDHLVVEMTEPRYAPLIGYAEAWSPSTQGDVVGTPVMIGGRTVAELSGMKNRLAGAIVMVAPEAAFIREDRPQPTTSDTPVRIGQPAPVRPRPDAAEARAVNEVIQAAAPAVTIRTSEGEHGTVFVLGSDRGDRARPSIVLAGEHYNMIARMLRRGIPVKLRINVQAHYVTDDPNSYNAIAELPGVDPVLKSEVVMIGAHLDSWHTGTGAADNADGVAVMLETMRILKTLGLRPKRTIRVALWAGEEEGLLGSKAYVKAHFEGDANKAARDRAFVYLNVDPATGPIYGWYMQDSEPAKALFDSWLAPLKDVGARRNVIAGIGNTDHLSFRAAGIPGFNPIQEYKDYDVRMHHTNVDLYERVDEKDLKQNAIVMAWFAWQAANTDQAIPRPEPAASGR